MKRHVLVVDDAADLRMLMKLAFEREGFRVTEAEDGAAAITALEAGLPDALVLDLRMPVLDGFGVLDWMDTQQLSRRFPIIVLTAYADRVTAAEIQTRGCSWAGKPFEVSYLVDQVRELLADPVGT
jgi:CheY-like chemotaxis protein